MTSKEHADLWVRLGPELIGEIPDKEYIKSDWEMIVSKGPPGSIDKVTVEMAEKIIRGAWEDTQNEERANRN